VEVPRTRRRTPGSVGPQTQTAARHELDESTYLSGDRSVSSALPLQLRLFLNPLRSIVGNLKLIGLSQRNITWRFPLGDTGTQGHPIGDRGSCGKRNRNSTVRYAIPGQRSHGS
jgi:hypothetical protein